MYIYLKYSKHGYEIAVVGESENTASYMGINVKRVIMRTMASLRRNLRPEPVCCSSAAPTTPTTTTWRPRLHRGNGFLAREVQPHQHDPDLLLLVFLDRGADEISDQFGLNTHSFAEILTGIIIFFIIGSEFFINYKVILRKKQKGGERRA